MSSSSDEASNSSANRIACVACRAIKVKCDRKDPCSRCLAKKIDCTYSSRRKPGPIQGRVTDLRQIIKKLRADLNEQRERNEALEKTFHAMSKSMENDDMRLSGHMANMNTLNSYIGVYFDKGFTFLQVHPPFENLNDYYKKQDMRHPLMNSIFGVGALLSGNQKHAMTFVSQIQSVQALDDVSPYICAMNFVLSEFYAASGDEERNLSYNNRAVIMAEILAKRSKTERGIDINVIRKYSSIKQALQVCNLSLLDHIMNSNEGLDDKLSAFTVAHIENNVLLWAIQAIHKVDMSFIHSHNLNQMFTLLNFAEKLVVRLETPMRQMLLMRLCAAKLLVNMLALHDDIAHQVAQHMLGVIVNPESILIDHPYFTLAPLLVTGQFYMLFGTFTNEFQQLLHRLARVDTNGLVQSILLQTKKNDTVVGGMVSWCYFYPQLTVYREKCAEIFRAHYSVHTDGYIGSHGPRFVELSEYQINEHSSEDGIQDSASNNSNNSVQLELNLDSFR